MFTWSACRISKLGETVLAWIKLKSGEHVRRTRCATTAAARSRTSRSRRYVRFVDAFPMTVTGKIQKFKIREAELQMRDSSG